MAPPRMFMGRLVYECMEDIPAGHREPFYSPEELKAIAAAYAELTAGNAAQPLVTDLNAENAAGAPTLEAPVAETTFTYHNAGNVAQASVANYNAENVAGATILEDPTLEAPVTEAPVTENTLTYHNAGDVAESSVTDEHPVVSVATQDNAGALETHQSSSVEVEVNDHQHIAAPKPINAQSSAELLEQSAKATERDRVISDMQKEIEQLKSMIHGKMNGGNHPNPDFAVMSSASQQGSPLQHQRGSSAQLQYGGPLQLQHDSPVQYQYGSPVQYQHGSPLQLQHGFRVPDPNTGFYPGPNLQPQYEDAGHDAFFAAIDNNVYASMKQNSLQYGSGSGYSQPAQNYNSASAMIFDPFNNTNNIAPSMLPSANFANAPNGGNGFQTDSVDVFTGSSTNGNGFQCPSFAELFPEDPINCNAFQTTDATDVLANHGSQSPAGMMQPQASSSPATTPADRPIKQARKPRRPSAQQTKLASKPMTPPGTKQNQAETAITPIANQLEQTQLNTPGAFSTSGPATPGSALQATPGAEQVSQTPTKKRRAGKSSEEQNTSPTKRSRKQPAVPRKKLNEAVDQLFPDRPKGPISQLWNTKVPEDQRTLNHAAVAATDPKTRGRPLAEIMHLKFQDLTLGEKARLLLPLLGGIDPIKRDETDEEIRALAAKLKIGYGAARERVACMKAQRKAMIEEGAQWEKVFKAAMQKIK